MALFIRSSMVLTLVAAGALAMANTTPPATTLTYVRRADKSRLKTTITIRETSKGRVIVKKNAEEHFRIECDKRGNTRRWQLSSKKKRIRMRAKRHGNAIYLEGTADGEKVDKRLDVDGRPWYQDVGFNAVGFVRSSRKQMVFWMVHPKKAEAYKMKITKEGTETVNVKGKRYRAVKTKMVVDKFLVRSLWAGYHWHRASDGLFLRYRSKGGMPGTPKIQVEITAGM